jgi:hypothetical protein
MVASHITKKRRKQKAYKLAEQQVAEEIMTTYLSWWSKQQIQTLVNTGELIMLPLPNSNGYRINQYDVYPDSGAWAVDNKNNDKKILFSSKISAVMYCLLEYKKLYKRSIELRAQDQSVRRLDHDYQLYRHKYKSASAAHDGFAQDLYDARLSDVGPKLTAAQEYLDKLINSAKYIKIWDKQP